MRTVLLDNIIKCTYAHLNWVVWTHRIILWSYSLIQRTTKQSLYENMGNDDKHIHMCMYVTIDVGDNVPVILKY